MDACDDFIKYVENILPDIVRTKDLIKIGIYRSDNGAALARKSGKGPEYFQLNKRVILYPKKAVIEYLKSKKGKKKWS